MTVATPQSRHGWLPPLLAGLPLLVVSMVAPDGLAWFARWQEAQVALVPWRAAFSSADAVISVSLFMSLGILALAVASVGGLLALFMRSALAHRALRWGIAAAMIAVVIQIIAGWWVVGTYAEVTPPGEEPLLTAMAAFWHNLSIFLSGLVWLLVLQASRWLASSQVVRHHYGAVVIAAPGEQLPMADGDARWEDLRTGGKDPSFRRAWQSSLLLFITVLFGPYLLTMLGCIEPYRVPVGAGTPVVQVVVTTQVKKTEEILLNEYSSISFDTPDPTESDALAEVETETQNTYDATQAGTPGQLGDGQGDEGGWPDGLPGGELRWIQLSFGQGSDDGLRGSPDNAIKNFMTEFSQLPQVSFPVRQHGEQHSIALLNNYPEDQMPPWVVMTSDYRFSIGGTDMKTLQSYVENGGMIFGDAGSPAFHRSFMGFMKTLGNRMGLRPVAIGRDDAIHNAPFQFPDGFPQVSDHGGGSSPMGLKNKEGRWIVYYFPGDLNDAWKDQSSVDKRNRQKAFNMGVNIIYYAVTNYVKIAAKKRQ